MKKILVLITVILVVVTGKAQFNSENINSQSTNKTLGKICYDNNGNIILTGTFSTSLTLGSYTVTNNTPYNPSGQSQMAAWIAKKSLGGNILWATTINLMALPDYSSSVYIFGSSTDAAGNTYVTGTFWGKINFGSIILTSTKLGSAYTQDMFTAKISPNGIFQWAKLEGTAEETWWGGEPGISVTTDVQGNVYTTGRMVLKILKNTGNCSYSPNSPVFCIYIVKYNPLGVKVWEKKFAPAQPSRTICGYQHLNYGTAINSDGSNIYVAGVFYSTVSFGGVNLSTGSDTIRNAFLLKLNQAGTTIWARSVTGSANGGAEHLLLDNNGNDIYLAGGFPYGTISFGGPAVTANAPTRYLAKYNSTGTCSWAVTSGIDDARYAGPFKHPNGTIGMLLVSPNLISSSPTYFGIKEFSPVDGSIINSTDASINAPFISSGESIGSVPTGFIYSQSLKGTYDIGGNTVSSTQAVESNYSDLTLVTYTVPTPPAARQEMITKEIASSDIVLYPNPASNEITLRNNSDKILGNLTLYDVSGKMIYRKFIGNSQATIDVKNFSSGFYYIRSDELQATIKFIKR